MEAVVAVAALLLSVVTAIVQIVIAMRGPVIVAMPLGNALLYWDGTKSGAVLTAAFQTTLFNTASADHGDLVDRAEMTIRSKNIGPVTFPLQSLIQPHLIDDPQRAVDRCDLVDRCIPLDGLVVIELAERLIALPGGQARSDYMTFAFSASDCKGRDCAKFRDFDAAVRALNKQTISAEIALHFSVAHSKMLPCKIPLAVDGSRLQKHRWLSFSCS